MIREIIFVVFLTTAANSFSIRAGCYVSVNDDLADPQTLALKPEGPSEHEGNDVYFWPTEGDEIIFEEGENVLLACPGGTVNVAGSNLGVESAEAKCKSGNFEIDGDTVPFSRIYCSRLPFHTARYTGETCLDDYLEIEIGFLLEDDSFIRQITICFDSEEQNTLWSKMNMTQHIEGYQSGYPRPDFIQDDFYDVGSTSVEKLYTRDTQRVTINSLLGLSSSSNKYIQSSGDYFLSRGHMSAKADYVYGSQQRATFHYVNVGPQWQTFNGQNWNQLEMDTRTHISDFEKDVIVYTGSHGKTTLPHEETGEETELWLYVNGNEKGIPVPQVYWRIIYEPISKAGIAFVGINNPYHSKDFIEENEIFCKNICDQVSWLKWKADDTQKGYSYCCDVNELRKTIKEIPDFPVESILE